jgi:hypothetical protein
MNRFLLIPLAVCVFAFGAVYFAIASSPVLSEPAPYAVASTNPAPATAASPRLASFDQASTLILDGWPTRDRHAAMSRVMIFQPLYAKLGPLAQNWPDGRSNFLSSLELVTPEKRVEYPINFDRLTNEVHIFADNSWQPYQGWREANQPLLEKNDLESRVLRLPGS